MDSEGEFMDILWDLIAEVMAHMKGILPWKEKHAFLETTTRLILEKLYWTAKLKALLPSKEMMTKIIRTSLILAGIKEGNEYEPKEDLTYNKGSLAHSMTSKQELEQSSGARKTTSGNVNFVTVI
eukprot:Gb_11157 [translate_table: standard]